MIGSGVGLGLGAVYLWAGVAGDAAEHLRSRELAEAAAYGYADSGLASQGQGLRAGMERYSLRVIAPPATAPAAAAVRAAAKARRRTELECLTDAVYYEARGESPRGQAAVAQVVMNRVKHPAFPDTVCGVVFQGAARHHCQFSFACDGSMGGRREALAWKRARKVALQALSGAVLADVGAATHFHTTGVSPAWGPRMLKVATVGMHVFYKLTPYRLRRNAPTPPPPSAPAPELAQAAVLISAPAADVPALRLAPAVVVGKTPAAVLQPASIGPAPVKAAAAAPAPVAVATRTAAPSKPAAPKAAASKAAPAAPSAPAASAEAAGLGPPRPATAAVS